MNRHRKLVFSIASAAAGLAAIAASPAHAASLTMLPRSTWTGGVTLPSYVQMYIYVPDKMAAKPPIVVSAHSCGSTASGQIGNIPMFKAAADAQGFILVLPDNPGQNCWDVGTDASLMHDGGGDTQAIAQMVKYALMKYSGDSSRVYIMGGSSGAMLTQAMLAVYPDLFRAGSARAGVPAGCWHEQYDPSMQWSTPCATGTVSHTAMQWGDMVRKMDPGYMARRPRVQLMQGESDVTIYYENMAESIKQWTNVLGLATTPTSMDMSYKGSVSTWDRQFWKDSCGYQVLEAWSAPGQGHSMGYEEAAMLTFFGLTTGSTMDPEPDCTGGGAGGGSGSAGSTGTAGSSGSGGTMGAGGGSGTKDGGVDATTDGGGSPDAGAASGGSTGTTGSGGAVGTGGSRAGTGGVSASGGNTVIATGGSSSGGTHGGSGGSASGGSSSTGSGSGGSSTSSGSGGSSSSASGGSSGGCAVAGSSGSASTLAFMLLVTVGAIVRRRRRR